MSMSLAGQSKFLNSTVDYTIGDYQLSAANYNATGRPIVQFPIALGSVVIYANITNFTTPNSLRLNGTVAAAIFQGNITTWDHPDILAINPNLTYVLSLVYCFRAHRYHLRPFPIVLFQDP